MKITTLKEIRVRKVHREQVLTFEFHNGRNHAVLFNETDDAEMVIRKIRGLADRLEDELRTGLLED